jgi:hypothetical protein
MLYKWLELLIVTRSNGLPVKNWGIYRYFPAKFANGDFCPRDESFVEPGDYIIYSPGELISTYMTPLAATTSFTLQI